MGAQPDYATARRLVNEGKRLVAMGGDAWQASFALVNEAYVAYVWGDLERAQALFDEAIALLGRLGDEHARAGGMMVNGAIALQLGDAVRAEALLKAALPAFLRLGDDGRVGYLLPNLARVASHQARWERGARLLGAAAGRWEATGIPVPPSGGNQSYATATAEIRAVVGDTTFERAWAEGRAMSREQAVAYALTDEPTTT
jgi:hypothetical protein